MVPISTRRYLDRFPGAWRPVYPASPLPLPPATQYGSIPVDFTPHLCSSLPELGVLTLEPGSLIGPNGWVAGRGGYVLSSHSWHDADFPIQPASSFAGFRRRKLASACLSLASDWGDLNYAHFLLECLPRLHLFLAAGFTLDEISHVYVPVPPSPGAARMLARLNIDPARIVWARGREIIEAERLIVPSFPGFRRNYPAWVPTFLSSTFAPAEPVPAGRKLYLKRRSSERLIRNEDELAAPLREFGFEVYEPGSVDDEARLFAEAACVVAVHDAGMGNLAFCRPGTPVVEIVPTDHVYPYYYTLCAAAGLPYGYLAGPSDGSRPPNAHGRSPFHLTVDPAEFAAMLRDMSRSTPVSR